MVSFSFLNKFIIVALRSVLNAASVDIQMTSIRRMAPRLGVQSPTSVPITAFLSRAGYSMLYIVATWVLIPLRVQIIALLVCLFSDFLGRNLWTLSLCLGSPHPGSLPPDLMSQPPQPSGCGSSPNGCMCSQTQRSERGDTISMAHMPFWFPTPRPHPWSTGLHGSADSAFLSAVSGRQLQPEEPDAETEEDHSVSEDYGGVCPPHASPILSWAWAEPKWLRVT